MTVDHNCNESERGFGFDLFLFFFLVCIFIFLLEGRLQEKTLKQLAVKSIYLYINIICVYCTHRIKTF